MRIRSVLSAALLTLAAGQASADTIALTFSGGGSGLSAYNTTLGWSFTTSNTITVTALGMWDAGGNGLLFSHDVAIWANGGALLMSGTVQSGTADPLTSGFRFNSSLTGTTTLTPGTYVIGGVLAGPPVGDLIAENATASTASGIVRLQDRYGTLSNVLIRPDINYGPQEAGYFGPNFLFVNAVVTPEPGTVALFALGGLGLAGGVIRRRRKATAAK
jgi:hypothetical protein